MTTPATDPLPTELTRRLISQDNISLHREAGNESLLVGIERGI